MKHIKIFSLIILITLNLNAQWFRQAPTPTYANLNKIIFVTPDVGWTIGHLGYLAKTTDGGNSWFLQSSGSIGNLNDINFISSEIGFAVDWYGNIIKTFDGGNSWNLTYQSPNSSCLNSLELAGNGTLFVAGEEGSLLKSTDEGETWIEFDFGYLKHFGDIKFFNDSTGIIIGISYENSLIKYIILKTSDSGQNWNVSADSIRFALRKIHIVDEHSAYILCWTGEILKTINAGISWDTLYSGSSKILNNITFVDSYTGFIVGDSGTILKTTDAGDSWYIVADSITNYNLKTICFIDNNVGYAAGDCGQFLKTSDGGETWTLETKYQREYGDEFYNISFVDINFGVAVGFDGAISLTKDSGKSWLNKSTTSNDTWFDVDFVDTLTGIVVGNRIIKTTDGGQTWVQKSSFGGGGMDCAKENLIIVASGLGKILRSTDVGESWQTINLSTQKSLWGVGFADSNIVFVLGDSGAVYKSTDGGLTWIDKSIPVEDQFYRIKFVNHSIGVIVGINSIYKTTDCGETWIKQNLPTSYVQYNLWGIDFFDENNGIATGFVGWRNFGIAYWGGLILKTTNGGINWNTELVGTYEWFFGVSFLDRNNIWVASNCGILHTTNTGITFIDEDENYNSDVSCFQLQQNYPNPFNPNTKIIFNVTQNSFVTLKVYDILGKEIAALVNENKPVGNYEINFNASTLPSGVYFYKLQTGSFSETKKMILMK